MLCSVCALQQELDIHTSATGALARSALEELELARAASEQHVVWCDALSVRGRITSATSVQAADERAGNGAESKAAVLRFGGLLYVAQDASACGPALDESPCKCTCEWLVHSAGMRLGSGRLAACAMDAEHGVRMRYRAQRRPGHVYFKTLHRAWPCTVRCWLLAASCLSCCRSDLPTIRPSPRRYLLDQ